MAIYAAALIVGLPATAIAAVLVSAIIVSVLAMESQNGFVGTYGQLAAALLCFWIFLSDLDPAFRSEPAQKRLVIRPE